MDTHKISIRHKVWSLKHDVQVKMFVLICRWWSTRNKTNAGNVRQQVKCAAQSTTMSMNFKSWKPKDQKRDLGRLCSGLLHRRMSTKSTLMERSWPPRNEEAEDLSSDMLHGAVLEAGAANISLAVNALLAEATAAIKGWEKAAYWGMPNVIMETDAANLGCVPSPLTYGTTAWGEMCSDFSRTSYKTISTPVLTVCPQECKSSGWFGKPWL